MGNPLAGVDDIGPEPVEPARPPRSSALRSVTRAGSAQRQPSAWEGLCGRSRGFRFPVQTPLRLFRGKVLDARVQVRQSGIVPGDLTFTVRKARECDARSAYSGELENADAIVKRGRRLAILEADQVRFSVAVSEALSRSDDE